MFDTRFFRNVDGKCPILEALDQLPDQVKAKAYVRIERLAEMGNQLKRPECDYLQDGIYELRWRFVKVQYRILYFFAGESIVVLSHLITKEKEVPSGEIKKAIVYKSLFEKDPEKHTYVEE